MAFPTNPNVGQTYVFAGVTYTFTAQGAWKALSPGLPGVSSVQQALLGVGAPSSSLGIDSDYYVDLASGYLYGPRSAGAWPAVSGTQIFSSQNLVSGIGAPSTPVGGNGNYYLDLQSGLLYGAKASGAWPTPAIAQIFSPQSLLSGTGAPASSVGVNTDYYVDFATGLLYGPKSAGAWPASSGVSIFSPQAFIAGTGAPSNSVGSNGNYYVDLSTGLVYGPKVSGVWPVTANASIFSVQSLLSGSGAPSNTLGSNGNFYVDTQTGNYYGPKAAGVWPATFGGVYGPGTLLTGTGVPNNSFGLNGNYYLDSASGLFYGPKSAGAWPASSVLIPPTNTITGNSAGSPPVSTIGANGSYFVDTFSGLIYGPKSAGAWPATAINTPGRQIVADASYVVGAGINTVAYTSLTAARTVTLASAASVKAGSRLTIVDESGSCSGANVITYSGAGADTINGSSTGALNSAFASVTLESDGASKWTVISINNVSASLAQRPQCRLTLTSLVPVLLAGVAAAAAVILTPYEGNQIPLWNGATFAPISLTETSNILANTSVGNAGPFAACANAVFDMYVWGNAGAQTLTRSDMWQQTGVVTNTNASPAVFTQGAAHGCVDGTPVRLSVSGGSLSPNFTAGVTYYMVNSASTTFQLAATPGGAAINAAGASSGTITATEGQGIADFTTNALGRGAANAQSIVGGYAVNTNAITNGPSAGFGLYVGSIRTDASGATVTFNPFPGAASGGALASVNLWNTFNRVPVNPVSQDNKTSWTYTLGTPAWRAADASNLNRINFLSGQAEDGLFAAYDSGGEIATGSNSAIAVALDSTTTPSGRIFYRQGSTVTIETWHSEYNGPPVLGGHFFQGIEGNAGVAAQTTTFFGAPNAGFQTQALSARLRY